MKQMVVILIALLICFVVFACEKTNKPNNPDLEDPSYYFPINLYYKWTYVSLGAKCQPTEKSYVLTAASKTPRSEGSTWDLISSTSGDTSIVYRLGDTIFYKANVLYHNQPSLKVLVRPIRVGFYWKDWQYEYSVVGFQDVHSQVAGVTYRGCAKIRRTVSGGTKVNYFWWAPQFGKVKEAQYPLSDTLNCELGEELKELDKTPEFP